MKYILTVVLAALILIAGCVQTEQPVPTVTPAQSSEATPTITLQQETMHPLETSSAYVAPSVVVVITPQERQDPIIGTWHLVGDQKPTDCTAVLFPSNTGYLICTANMVQLADKDFSWQPITSMNGITGSYMINLTTGENYTAQYSEHNGWITSDILPPGTELIRSA
jgi:hypothetical protein